jgi:hypothetical protein
MLLLERLQVVYHYFTVGICCTDSRSGIDIIGSSKAICNYIPERNSFVLCNRWQRRNT